MIIFLSTAVVTSVFLVLFSFDNNNAAFATQLLSVPKNQDNVTGSVGNEGFLIDNEGPFKVSYPSNWIKEKFPPGRFSALESAPLVGFVDLEKGAVVVIAFNGFIGNRLLSEYVGEETAALNGAPNFNLDQSSPAILGNNTAQKLVYTSSLIKNGVIADTVKTMEVVTIKEDAAYFFVYRAKVNDFPTLLPIVNKMIDLFEFK
jgi:hypothetical protein